MSPGHFPGSLRAAEHPARGLQQRPLREADGGRARPENARPGLETVRRGGQGDRWPIELEQNLRDV